jgi:hypothetical protein
MANNLNRRGRGSNLFALVSGSFLFSMTTKLPIVTFAAAARRRVRPLRAGVRSTPEDDSEPRRNAEAIETHGVEGGHPTYEVIPEPNIGFRDGPSGQAVQQ